MAVGRVDRVGPEDQEDVGEREGKDRQQEVSSREEDRPGEGDEDQVGEDVEVLRRGDDDPLLLEEFPHVVEGLQDRRSDPPLHPRGDLTIDPRYEAARDGREDEEEDRPDKPEPVHKATPAKTHDARISTMQTTAPGKKSRASPKYPVR
ncbi:hypothetical protein DSECCO2_545090 [anaerobic digester metagenome]